MRFVTNGSVPKIETACSRDDSRVTLTKPYLKLDKPKKGKPQTGTIAACDSYILAVVPVEFNDDETPTEGHVEPKAFSEARKSRISDAPVFADDVKVLSRDGVISFPAPTVLGQYPDVAKLMPEEDTISHFSVGLNTALLKKLADALGTEGVVLEFVVGPEASAKLADGTEYRLPTNMKGIRVRPLFGGSSTHSGIVDGPVGIMMPIRIKS